MENNKIDFSLAFKFILIHIILYPITYAVDMVNFCIILSSNYKRFFTSYFIIEGLVIIFIVKLLLTLKSKNEPYESIRCSIIIYFFLSFLSLILVGIQYGLILINFNFPKSKMDKKYKIPFICLGILYHIYNNLIFIYENYIIIKAYKKHLEDRFNLEQRRTNIKDKNLNDTKSSDKIKKVESFVKEDTIYIIRGNFKENSINSEDKKNIYVTQNNNSLRSEINLKNENEEKKNMPIINKKKEKEKNNNDEINNDNISFRNDKVNIKFTKININNRENINPIINQLN